jgi:DtxR family Mn-dependent transcriptional regulator
MERLTVKMENYLEAIYDLTVEKGKARLSDVAARMQVTKASACTAMNVLAEKQLIHTERYRGIFLTSAGYRMSYALSKNHYILRKLLIDVIEEEPDLANADACAIEHVISSDALNKIHAFLVRWYAGEFYRP